MTTKRLERKRHFRRYSQIVLVVAKHRLAKTIKTMGLGQPLPFRWASWLSPSKPWRKDMHTAPQHVRMALEELGTTFVKIGQILSTRVDLLPAEFVVELEKLQNSLQPVSVEVIKERILVELGRPVEELFATFDPNPIGVASIGQAHSATLHDGTEVVVKARKPGVADQVKTDLEILHNLAAALARRQVGPQQYNLVAIVDEIAQTLLLEMDYAREGHSAEHFAQLFLEDPTVHIPKIHWNLTTSRILTMERIHGVKISDMSALEKAGIDRNELALRCVNIWLKMLFEGVAFHADPHPGNIFLEKDGRLALLDFGMVGMVDDEMRENLATAFQAILAGDADLLADSLIELGAVPSAHDGSREKLRSDLKHFLNLYPNLTVAELTVGVKLKELFTVIRSNQIQLPSNTFILLKTVVMAESLAVGLNPDFVIITALEPHIRRLMKKRYSLSTIVGRMPAAAGELAVMGMQLPRRLKRLLRSVELGEINVRTHVTGLDHSINQLDKLVHRLVVGFVLGSVIIALAVLATGYRLL
jgi:ubiquinone biosynthesis protein